MDRHGHHLKTPGQTKNFNFQPHSHPTFHLNHFQLITNNHRQINLITKMRANKQQTRANHFKNPPASLARKFITQKTPRKKLLLLSSSFKITTVLRRSDGKKKLIK
jgi:hypothetical protein